MWYCGTEFLDDSEDQHASLLQKDTGFDRLVSTTTAEPGAELPELKDSWELNTLQRMATMRPSNRGLKGVAGLEDIEVTSLADPVPDLNRSRPRVPRRTWAITPDSPEALKPPCKEDLDRRKSVEFHPMVVTHLLRR
ncbi:unnamed protein product [Durusdinium trenchii]|uniref:Uncharacterized protein n=1 Tax=Durusdinium trenchii TaxID=1381693 RepID=A0ABP0KTP3_9DINO